MPNNSWFEKMCAAYGGDAPEAPAATRNDSRAGRGKEDAPEAATEEHRSPRDCPGAGGEPTEAPKPAEAVGHVGKHDADRDILSHATVIEAPEPERPDGQQDAISALAMRASRTDEKVDAIMDVLAKLAKSQADAAEMMASAQASAARTQEELARAHDDDLKRLASIMLASSAAAAPQGDGRPPTGAPRPKADWKAPAGKSPLSGRGFTVACIVFAVAAIGVFVFAASRLMAAIGGVGSGI